MREVATAGASRPRGRLSRTHSSSSAAPYAPNPGRDGAAERARLALHQDRGFGAVRSTWSPRDRRACGSRRLSDKTCGRNRVVSRLPQRPLQVRRRSDGAAGTAPDRAPLGRCIRGRGGGGLGVRRSDCRGVGGATGRRCAVDTAACERLPSAAGSGTAGGGRAGPHADPGGSPGWPESNQPRVGRPFSCRDGQESTVCVARSRGAGATRAFR